MTLQAPPHLSPSSINTFQSCPLKFKFSKIDGMVEPPTVHTLLGNFVHDILESLYLLNPEDRTKNTARELAREHWGSKYEMGAKDLRLEGREFRWKAWWCVENLWKLENPQETELRGVEHEVFGQVEGITIKGFIDRYKVNDDGTLVIEDYKTGKVPDARFADDKFVQLFIYAVMLKELGVGDASSVSLMYLTAPKVLTRDVSEQALSDTVSLIVNTKNKIDQYCADENFPTKKSGLCNWCNFKKICPAWTK